MELLSTWRNLYKLRYCPVTLIQTAFSAGTVYLLIAMQATSGARIARKELRHSLDQETLVQQYLQEIGMSWNCATKISATLRNLMNEQVRPLLDILDRKNIPNTASLHTSADMDDDEESNSGRSRSSSRKRSSVTTLAPQISLPHNISSGSGQSSLSTAPNHILTFPTQVQPPAKPSISPTITISSARDASSNHAASSAPIAIHSLRSTSSNPSSFTDSWAHQPNPGSSDNFSYLTSSFAQPDLRKHAQPFSNFMDDPFSGNGNSNSDDVNHAFGGLVSFLAHNFQPLSGPSSGNHGYLGMLGGQTLSEAPFVGFLSEAEDSRSPNSSTFPGGASFGTGFPNQEPSSSLGVHVPSSHGDNDMDLDSAQWKQNFTS